jgi:hypothetical protein
MKKFWKIFAIAAGGVIVLGSLVFGGILLFEWIQNTFFRPQIVCYKPVIYLYPKEEQEITVKLELDGKLTCTYPAYNDGWTVTAAPDGTLTDASGRVYNYLFWEGNIDTGYDTSRGFCVKGDETADFLEDSLKKLGLSDKESADFITYWLPKMQDNPYNIITFAGADYTDKAKLSTDLAPDTLIRVFMVWKASNKKIGIEPQELTAPERKGFTVVEWGGTEL